MNTIRLAALAGAPRPAEVAAHQHVHALEHDAVRMPFSASTPL